MMRGDKTMWGAWLEIEDHGHRERVSLDELIARHRGDAFWGVHVGFRAMQAAGQALSTKRLWDRQYLSVVSAHPGPGVRDAIDYVTRCVSRERFQLVDGIDAHGCHSRMQFQWWVRHGSCQVSVRLRDGFVPTVFFDLLDRIGSLREQPRDEDDLSHLKNSLIDRVWADTLDQVFDVTEGDAVATHEVGACTN